MEGQERLLDEQSLHEYDQYSIEQLNQMLATQRNDLNRYTVRLHKFIVADPEATVGQYSLLSAQKRQAEILVQKLIEVIDWRTVQEGSDALNKNI